MVAIQLGDKSPHVLFFRVWPLSTIYLPDIACFSLLLTYHPISHPCWMRKLESRCYLALRIIKDSYRYLLCFRCSILFVLLEKFHYCWGVTYVFRNYPCVSFFLYAEFNIIRFILVSIMRDCKHQVFRE